MRRWRLAGAAVLMAGLAGCADLGYLSQSVRGHLGIVAAARPVPAWLGDPTTPEAVQERLRLSQRMRDFAVQALRLPDNASYRRYADLQRSAAVWNVVAAPELGLDLKTSCFPVVGCVGYRGYFDRADADAAAQTLRASGLEVAVYGVPAYSTLGKLPGDAFADPLLNTFLNYPELELARLIFHELAHQVAYAAGDTEFNESFATAVERLGGERWLAQQPDDRLRQDAARADARRQDFRDLTLRTRQRLAAIYAGPGADDAKREAKRLAMDEMRVAHQRLKAGPWAGYSGYDRWFAEANNASLALMSAYNDQVPRFIALFERQGRDFERFYAEVRRLASLPADQRRLAMAALAP